MSAPLVINLTDGSVWERRAVSRAGVALYALAGACPSCPEFVMASEPELAELGIAGSADVLPVPVGSGPQAALPWAWVMADYDLHLFLDDLVAAAMNRWRTEPDGSSVPDRVTLTLVEQACARWRTPGQGPRSDEAERDPVEELIGANLSLWEEERETARLRLALESARRGRRELRARVAALEAERHVTNEALDDAVGELRVHLLLAERGHEMRRAKVAELEAAQGTLPPLFVADYDGAPLTLHLTREAARAACEDVAKIDAHGSCWDWRTEEDGTDRQFWTHPDDDRPTGYTGGAVWQIEVEQPGSGADGITRRFAPTQALRDDEPAEAPYVSRLLPPRDAVCARPGCGHTGADHHHGDTKCWATLPRTRQPNGAWSAVATCGCEGFVAESGGAS